MKNEIWTEALVMDRDDKLYGEGVSVTLTQENNGYAFWLNDGNDRKLLWFKEIGASAAIKMAVLDVHGDEQTAEITEAITAALTGTEKPCSKV